MWILLDGTITKTKQITISGITYPPQMFRDDELRTSLGIKRYRVEQPDQRYYTFDNNSLVKTDNGSEVVGTYTAIPKPLEDELKFNEDGTPMLDEQGNQVVTKGLKSALKAKVKTQAGNEILAKYPEWKQRNYTARYLELVEKKFDGTATPEELLELPAIKAIYEDINAMRMASDAKEAEIDALTTIEEVIAYENQDAETI